MRSPALKLSSSIDSEVCVCACVRACVRACVCVCVRERVGECDVFSMFINSLLPVNFQFTSSMYM